MCWIVTIGRIILLKLLRIFESIHLAAGMLVDCGWLVLGLGPKKLGWMVRVMMLQITGLASRGGAWYWFM